METVICDSVAIDNVYNLLGVKVFAIRAWIANSIAQFLVSIGREKALIIQLDLADGLPCAAVRASLDDGWGWQRHQGIGGFRSDHGTQAEQNEKEGED